MIHRNERPYRATVHLISPLQANTASPTLSSPRLKVTLQRPPANPCQTDNRRLIRHTPRTHTVLPQLRASVIAITDRRIRGRDRINQHPVVH